MEEEQKRRNDFDISFDDTVDVNRDANAEVDAYDFAGDNDKVSYWQYRSWIEKQTSSTVPSSTTNNSTFVNNSTCFNCNVALHCQSCNSNSTNSSYCHSSAQLKEFAFKTTLLELGVI